MPTIEENRSFFAETYDWSHAGEEWSEAWGGVQMQWYGSILPRISAFVPADTILEIAPGYGRWTAFLKDLCNRLIVVDLSEKCIDKCRQRFEDYSHISYFVNDGQSLEMIADHSIDFIFSFDSLVHAEETVLEAYAAEFAKKLRSRGAAFVHHSNVGEYIYLTKLQCKLSKYPTLFNFLKTLRICDNVNNQGRARSMTAGKMETFAEEHRLQCISQELITWDSRFALVDCLSTLVPRGSRWSRQNRVLKNPGFWGEAKRLSDLSRLYEWRPAADRNYGREDESSDGIASLTGACNRARSAI
jgi:ubiquinone/menaquinone biosynthesis C-methylase UbiE